MKFYYPLILILLPFHLLFAKIFIYNSYCNNSTTYIDGRLIKKDTINAKKNDNFLLNIIQKINLFFHNEIKNSKVYAKIDSKTFIASSDNEGYFHFKIDKCPKRMTLFLKNGINTTIVPLRYNNPKIGIISDFDDTLIISNVPNKAKLLYNNLVKNYKQRKLITTTAKSIKELLSLNSNAPFVIISGSPYQLYVPIKNFLKYHKFPNPILKLKKIHGKNKESFDQYRYKIDKITKIFKEFPNTKWYLFGDNGEKDQEVYKYLKEHFPNRVISYSIHKVK